VVTTTSPTSPSATGSPLPGRTISTLQPIAQRRRKGLAAEHRLGQRDDVRAALGGLLDEDLQKARRADVGVGFEFTHRLQLQLGVADAAGEDGAAECQRARLHHQAARRQVVGKAVVRQVAIAQAGGEHCARQAPVVARVGLGFVDRPRRLIDALRRPRARQCAPAERGEAAEGIGFDRRALAFQQLRFARHGQHGERGARCDRTRIDSGEHIAQSGRGLRRTHLRRQRGHQGCFARGGVARFQCVEERVHSSLSHLPSRFFTSSSSLR
jgi:hypothetical protein